MKFKILCSLALLAGFCSVQSARAQVYGPFNPPFGDSETYNIWYDDRTAYDNRPFTAYWDTGQLGTDLTGPYLPHDIVGSFTTDGLTWSIRPETNKFYNGGDVSGTPASNIWRSAPFDATADGGAYHESLTFYGRTMVGTETNVILVYTINGNTLDTNRYEIEGFIKVVDVADGTAFIETNLSLNGVTSGTYTQTMTVTDAGTWAPAPLQAGFRLLGTNANPAFAASYGQFDVTIDDLILIAPDPTPPTPDPMTFDVVPFTISDNKIGMTATTATDISGVEYNFQGFTTFPAPPAYNSGWVSDPNHVADGLLPNTAYQFRVAARDLSSSQNTTTYSGLETASTLPTDTTIPSPDPAEIAAIDGSPQSIKITATPATDDSAVQYNFVCTAGDGVDSGWIDSNVYVNTSLASSSNFTWTVQVRDLSAATNTTAVSASAGVTTEDFPISGAVSNSLKSYTGTNNDNELVHEVLKDTFDFADYLPNDRRIVFDSSGATFGSFGGGDFGRNVMRTLANNYAADDFTAEFTINGWTPQEVGGVPTNGTHVFLGFGPGVIGSAGVPDWSPDGGLTAASFIVELDGVNMTIWSQPENYVDPTFTSNTFQTAAAWITTNDTWRVRLAYDNALNEATVSIDLTYDGVTFNTDITSGPIVAPDPLPVSKIYIAGDDGIVLSDWDIDAAGLLPLVPVTDLVILSSDGTTATLQWTGVTGQKYDVEYSTDLTSGFVLDGANDDISGAGGVQSTTSSAGGADTFFQISTDYE
jgi:hypothetical protein